MSENAITNSQNPTIVWGLAPAAEFHAHLHALCQAHLKSSDTPPEYKHWAARQSMEFAHELAGLKTLIKRHPKLVQAMLHEGQLRYIPFVAGLGADALWRLKPIGCGSNIRCSEIELPQPDMAGDLFDWSEFDAVIKQYNLGLSKYDGGRLYWQFQTPIPFILSGRLAS